MSKWYWMVDSVVASLAAISRLPSEEREDSIGIRNRVRHCSCGCVRFLAVFWRIRQVSGCFLVVVEVVSADSCVAGRAESFRSRVAYLTESRFSLVSPGRQILVRKPAPTSNSGSARSASAQRRIMSTVLVAIFSIYAACAWTRRAMDCRAATCAPRANSPR